VGETPAGRELEASNRILTTFGGPNADRFIDRMASVKAFQLRERTA
jgi:hypothetical protein